MDLGEDRAPVTLSSYFGYSRLLGPTYNYSGSWHANAIFTKFTGRPFRDVGGYSFVQFPPSLLQTAVATAAGMQDTGVVVTFIGRRTETGWFPEP